MMIYAEKVEKQVFQNNLGLSDELGRSSGD
jgi:hypothetical protein